MSPQPSADLIAIVDSNFRDLFFMTFAFASPNDYKMYTDLDILHIIEWTHHHFEQITRKFRLTDEQVNIMSVVCMVYAIKYYSDVEMKKPYSFIWDAVVETGYTRMMCSRMEWLRDIEFYEYVLLMQTTPLHE